MQDLILNVTNVTTETVVGTVGKISLLVPLIIEATTETNLVTFSAQEKRANQFPAATSLASTTVLDPAQILLSAKATPPEVKTSPGT